MKRKLFVALVLFSIFGLAVPSFGQVDISGDWLFDISGLDKGGAVVNLETGGNLTGYGITRYVGAFSLEGNYVVDPKGRITGTFTERSLLTDEFLGNGILSGKVSKTGTISLKVVDGATLKGKRLPAEPVVPANWAAKVKTSIGTVYYNCSITPSSEYNRVFMVNAEGTTPYGSQVTAVGGFFLDSKNKAYGIYEAYEDNAFMEYGIFSGKVNLSSNKFSFKLENNYGDEAVMMGEAILP